MRRSKGSERPKEKAKRKEPLTEEEIDAPSRQTLIMLAVICLVTLISWAAGRAACNYHPPSESRTPRKVTLEDRTRTPKDVGIAFGQAIALGDFSSAEKLTIGEAAEVLKKEKAACRDCAKRAESGKKALSVGVVLQANSVDAIVQVRTTGASFGEKVRILGIERKDRDWRVSRVFESAQAAKLNPPPPPVEAPPALAPEGTEGAATPPGPGEPGDSEGSGAQSAPGVVPPSGPPAQPAPED
jgi:hypothetical protein